MERKELFRRKRLLINKRLQFQYIGIIVVSLVIIVSWIGWDVYQGLKNILPQVYYPEARKDIINVQLILVLKTFIFIFLISILSLYYSHRIAGPLYRLEKDISQMIKGSDLTQTFKLRKHDELKELAAALNKLTMQIREQFVYEEGFRDNLRRVIEEIVLHLREKRDFNQSDRDKVITELEKLSDLSNVSLNFKV